MPQAFLLKYPRMNEVVLTVAPVFGLIALGYLAAHFKILSTDVASGVAAFVFTIAMPCLIFRTLVTVEQPKASSLGLLMSFMGAAAITWLLATLVTRWPLRRPIEDSASIAMGATFGNTVMMGIPLVLGYYGEEALVPLVAIIAIHAPAMWLAATLQVELSARDEATSFARMFRDLLRDLSQNPVILGIVFGGLWRLTGLGFHPVADKITELLGQAGVPGALFALGMSLERYEIRGQIPTLIAINMLKLLVMPAVAWFLADQVLNLRPLWTAVVVLLAACPTGANAFLFASRYDLAVGSVSGSIALSTALSALTISALLALLGLAE